MGHGGFNMWGGLFMLLEGLVVIVLFVVLIGWLLRKGSAERGASSGQRRGSDRALEILRQRYARGEIDQEEFDHKRRELEK